MKDLGYRVEGSGLGFGLGFRLYGSGIQKMESGMLVDKPMNLCMHIPRTSSYINGGMRN